MPGNLPPNNRPTLLLPQFLNAGMHHKNNREWQQAKSGEPLTPLQVHEAIPKRKTIWKHAHCR